MAGVRFWADNSNSDRTALLKESQEKILIPIVKDPNQIGRISGMFHLGSGREIVAEATVVLSGPQHQAALTRDLKFILESVRRRLKALGVSYEGSIEEQLIKTPPPGSLSYVEQGGGQGRKNTICQTFYE